MKLPKKLAIIGFTVWLLTLGLHIGTLPGGVPINGTKDAYFWDEFVEGKRDFHALAFMEVPHYQVGIPYLFTYSGGAMPASVDLALDSDNSLEGKVVVINKATLVYDDGHSYDIIRENSPRSGILSVYERDGKEYCRARIAIPNCIWKKQDFRIIAHGFVQNEDSKVKIEETLRVIYSENSYVYLGWFLFLLRGL